MRTLIAAYICAALVLIACGHAAPPMPVTPIMAIDSRSVDSSTITLVPSHVMLATYGTTSYGGTSSAVPISYQCAHDTWVYQGAETAAYESAGCKVMLYTQVWRAYMAKTTAEDVVNNTDLTITNALALAKSCNGKVLSTTAYGGTVYLMDPRSSRAASHFDNVVNYEWGARGVYPDALFLDNTAANADFSGLCDYSYSTWINAVKTVAGSSAHPAFMNLLNAWLNGGTPAGNVAAESPNVLGGMCESCYLNNAGVVSGTNWQRQEQGEIASIQAHKIFWAYARNTTAANSSTGQALRMYGYASFLLTYDPQYTMYQTALYTPLRFRLCLSLGWFLKGRCKHTPP